MVLAYALYTALNSRALADAKLVMTLLNQQTSQDGEHARSRDSTSSTHVDEGLCADTSLKLYF